MLRVTLIHLALFLLPFVVYVFWVVVKHKISAKKAWQEGPNLWLGVAGLFLVITSLMILATFQEAPSGAGYKPAEFRDGVLVPGGYEKSSENGQ